jgi:hypothetical protein
LNGKLAAPVLKTEINGRGDPLRRPHDTSFANKRRPLGRYSSLADYKPRSLVFSFYSFRLIEALGGVFVLNKLSR